MKVKIFEGDQEDVERELNAFIVSENLMGHDIIKTDTCESAAAYHYSGRMSRNFTLTLMYDKG